MYRVYAYSQKAEDDDDYQDNPTKNIKTINGSLFERSSKMSAKIGDVYSTTTVNYEAFSVYRVLRPVFAMSMLLGMTPLTNVTASDSRKVEFRWLSLPFIYSVAVVIGLMVGVYVMGSSYMFVLSTQQDINDVVLALTAPVFYLSNTLALMQCIQVSRKLPQLLRTWDEVAVRLPRYLSDLDNDRRNRIKSADADHSTVMSAGSDRHVDHDGGGPVARVHLSQRRALAIALIFTASAAIEMTLHDLNLPIHLCRGYNYTSYFHCYLVRGNSHFNGALGEGVPLQIFIYVIQKYANVAWNFLDLLLIVVALALRANFKVIADHVRLTHRSVKSAAEWRCYREDHLRVADLTEQLDKAINLMVLQSYAINLFYICLQVSLAIRPIERTPVQLAYFSYSLMHLVMRTTAVSASASAVHEQASAPLQYLFDCPTASYCTEVYRFTTYLMNIPIGFTGYEFFIVNRQIFLALLSVIITYELILLKLA